MLAGLLPRTVTGEIVLNSRPNHNFLMFTAVADAHPSGTEFWHFDNFLDLIQRTCSLGFVVNNVFVAFLTDPAVFAGMDLDNQKQGNDEAFCRFEFNLPLRAFILYLLFS